MARQFPRLHLRQKGDECLIDGNVAGLKALEWMVSAALKDSLGLVDECGQVRYGCKHGDDTIQVTVRNRDEFEKLPPCKACGGNGVDVVGDGDPSHCRACDGSGREVPERARHRLPFFT